MHAILTQGYATSITPGNFQSWKPEYPIQCMQTAQETRKQRLLLLKKKHGTWAALNKLIGRESTNARLSQIGAGSIRSGWMDTPLTYAELHGEDDPRAKAMQLMEALPPDQWATAVRLLAALAQPVRANGTTGHH